MNWSISLVSERRTLLDLVEVIGGGTPSRSEPLYWGGDIPWATVKDLSGLVIRDTAERITREGLENSAANVVPAGAIVLATRIAPGRAALAKFDLAINQDLKGLVPRDGVDAAYLLHFIRASALRIARMGAGSTVKGITLESLARVRILLPDLAEQRRTAAMLDKADGIQRKRRESVRLVDELVRSAYVSIVGAGNSNYRHWPEMEIADLAERRDGSIRTGPFGSALRHGEFTNQGEVAVLGIDNVVENCFRWTERRFISRERYEKHFKRYTVRAGDVLVTIMGTTGKSAVAPEDLPVAISTKHLAVISLDQEHVRPEFLSHAIHGDPRVWAQIGAANRGAIMAGLNLGIIKRLRIRLPPVVHQARFERVVERVRHLRAGIVSARQTDEHLFRALAQGSFVVDMQ